MMINQQTPGMLFIDGPEILRDDRAGANVAPRVACVYTDNADQPQWEADARLLAAAYNAFDSAGRQMREDAAELAYSLRNGGLACLIDLAQRAVQRDPELADELDEIMGWNQPDEDGEEDVPDA